MWLAGEEENTQSHFISCYQTALRSGGSELARFGQNNKNEASHDESSLYHEEKDVRLVVSRKGVCKFLRPEKK